MKFHHEKCSLGCRLYSFEPHKKELDFFISDHTGDLAEVGAMLDEIISKYGRPGATGFWMYAVDQLTPSTGRHLLNYFNGDFFVSGSNDKVAQGAHTRDQVLTLEVVFSDPDSATLFKLTDC